MVFQSKASLIVMTTNIVENNQIKCEQYWPDVDTSLVFHLEHEASLQVELLDEVVGLAWTRRQIRITRNSPQAPFTATHEVRFWLKLTVCVCLC